MRNGTKKTHRQEIEAGDKANLLDDEQIVGTFSEIANHSKKRKKRNKYPSPVTFRPTEEERTMLKENAVGMSQSAYIRERLFGNRVSKRVVPEADRVLLAQILARLGETRISNNTAS